MYRIAGIASGNLGPTNFADAPFAITAVGDTANISVGYTGDWVIGNSVTAANVSVSGLGTAEILFTDLGFWLDQSQGVLSFESSQSGSIYDMFAPAFGSWDGASSLDPVSVVLVGGYFGFLDTSAGEIDWQFDALTFAASVSPEPSMFAICGLGFASLLFISFMRSLRYSHSWKDSGKSSI